MTTRIALLSTLMLKSEQLGFAYTIWKSRNILWKSIFRCVFEWLLQQYPLGRDLSLLRKCLNHSNKGRLVVIGHGFQLVPRLQSNSKIKTKPTLCGRKRRWLLADKWCEWDARQWRKWENRKMSKSVDQRTPPESLPIFSKVDKNQSCCLVECLLETDKSFRFWN